MSEHIQSIRKRVYNSVQKKSEILDGRTYGALLKKYYNVSTSKAKLLKFESSLSAYNGKGVTIANLKKAVQEEKKMVVSAKKELNVMLQSGKKIVSCYYTIFKPMPPTYNGSQSLQFKGESYIPLKQGIKDVIEWYSLSHQTAKA
jgi:hypothetical protein